MIAKFLVHLLGEGEGGHDEMREGKGRGKEWGENGEGMEVREMGMHEQIAPKPNRFGIWGRPLGAIAPCHTFYKALFKHNISVAYRMSLS